MKRALLMMALVLCASGALAQSQRQPPRPQPARPPQVQTSPLQQPAPDERGTEAQPIIVKVQEAPTDPAKAAEQERTRREEAENARLLTAYTKDLASYTSNMAWLTGGVALFTLFLFGATFTQVLLFRSQLRIMNQGLADTKTTAKAAQDSADTAKRALTELERPFVFVGSLDVLDSSPRRGRETCVRIGLKNHGRTPAVMRELTFTAHMTNRIPDDPAVNETIVATVPLSNVIGTDELFDTLWVRIDPDPRFCELIRNGMIRLQIVFGITYRDIFGREHPEQFDYMWDRRLEMFLRTEDVLIADDEERREAEQHARQRGEPNAPQA